MQKLPNTIDDFFYTDIEIMNISDIKNRQSIMSYSSNDYLRNIFKVYFFDNGLSVNCDQKKSAYNEIMMFDSPTFSPFMNHYVWGNTFIHYAFEVGYYKHDFYNKNNVYFKEENEKRISISPEKLINFLKTTQKFKVNWNDKIFYLWLDLLASIRQAQPLDIILTKQKHCLNEKNKKYLKSKIISQVSLEESLFLVALHNKNIEYIQHYMKNNEVKTLANKYIRNNKDIFHFFSQKSSYDYLAELEHLEVIDSHEIFKNLNFYNHNELAISSLYEASKLDKKIKTCNLSQKRNKL